MLTNVVQIGKEFLYLQQTNLQIMSETAMWAVGITLGVLLTVIGFLVQFSFNMLSNSFKDLKEGVSTLSHDLLLKIDEITKSLQSTNQEFIKILSRNDVQSQFIDEHTDEIERLKEKVSEIQINCAMNKHGKKASK